MLVCFINYNNNNIIIIIIIIKDEESNTSKILEKRVKYSKYISDLLLCTLGLCQLLRH